MKKLTFTILFLVFISLAMQAQDVSKQLIGKWALSELKLADAKGKGIKKMTNEQKTQLEDMKEIFLKQKMVNEFMADGSMTVSVISDDEPKRRTWKIIGKELEVINTKSDKIEKIPFKIKKEILELTNGDGSKGAFLVLVFKKVK